MAIIFLKALIICFFFIAVIVFDDGHCRSRSRPISNHPWSRPLHRLFTIECSILSKSSEIHTNKDIRSVQSFLRVMRNFRIFSKRLNSVPLCALEVRNEYMEKIVNEDVDYAAFGRELSGLLGSGPEEDTLRNIFGTILRLKENINGYFQEPVRGDSPREFELNMNDICPSGSVTESDEFEISIKDVCPDVDSCADGSRRYDDPNLQWLPALNTACDSQRKCDLNKALPLMAGIFWYQLHRWIEKRICVQKCASWNVHVHKGYLKLVNEAKLLTAYATILPEFWSSTWNNFFNQAVEESAYTNIITAMNMVREKEEFLNSTIIACNTLKFTEACPYADIFVEYRFIKKSQETRRKPSPVKDLRLYSDLDHSKMLQLQRDTSNHIELLGQIRNLDDNLKASVSGISSYFQGVARFDEGIADKDVLFIQGEIEKFNTSIIAVVNEVKENIRSVMGLVQAQMDLTLATELIDLALVVAENCNPMKLLFSGPDLDEIAEATNAVAEASVDSQHIFALKVAAEELGNSAKEITLALYNNQDQITGLQTLVNDIRKNSMVSVRENADRFIEEYGDYTPQTNRSALEKSNALWSAFKEAACALAEGDVGALGAIAKGSITGNLMCEKLEGSLAEFFTLREDMFDFQFQLVDAVAQVVRGSISKRLAEDIRGKHDILHASQLMIGFFMMQNKLQNVASAYCNILEYQRLGSPISACQRTTDGLFRYEHLDDLVAFKDKSPYAVVEREVYIPTRASYDGDTGYISLPALKTGKVVFFKLPANETWLRENRWILADQTSVPFVESINIYLPRKEYLSGENRQHQTFQVSVATSWGSAVSIDNPEMRIVYILPRGHSSYLTVYEEGYSSCSNEIPNPYSLCNNLPKLCDTSSRQTGESIIPTLLSTFKIQLSVSQGARSVDWDAPASLTNLKIRARVKLRIPLSQENIKKKRSLQDTIHQETKTRNPADSEPKAKDSRPAYFFRYAKARRPSSQSGQKSKFHRTIPSFDLSANGCCQGNKYRMAPDNNRCVDCPQQSTSKHSGLYCQISANH